MQERVADGAKENLLFFGCRDDTDFIYRDELEAWVKDGFLDLQIAFSRKEGTPKTYVQQLVAKQEAKIVDMVKRGAHIYICGDASKMAPAVKEAFSKIIAGAGLGEKFVDEMEEKG